MRLSTAPRRRFAAALTHRLGLVCSLAFAGWSVPAAAQEKIDSSIRAWGDVGIYSGELIEDELGVTAISPVLRTEVELSTWQLGLDLPFVLSSTFGDALDGGFGGRLGNPTLHFDYLMEEADLRATFGLAVAVPTSDTELDPDDQSEVAAQLGAGAATSSRGLWNMWWYTSDAWAIIVPATVDSASSDYELGLDAAVAWFLTRSELADNQGLFQVGLRGALVLSPAVVGLKLNGVFALTDGLLGNDHLQTSTELYAELRLPIVWLGAGFNVSLDEPLGVFGDGSDMWSLRLSAGAEF